MSGSLIALIAAGFIFFWAVGAYNRLVRLRAAVLRAFAALDNLLAVQPALIQASAPAEMDLPGGDAGAVPTADWSALTTAADQFAQALAAARAEPLHAQTMEALSAAQIALQRCWRGEGDEGVARHAVPAAVSARLQRQAEQAIGAAQLHDAAVQAYNRAIAEFPALLLAQLFRFSPAVAFLPVGLAVNTRLEAPI
ncbi:MAG: LemA family protein [Burkholderiaceae bacterium]|nr:LemA family protein [Burkholderiaceae bacterium]